MHHATGDPLNKPGSLHCNPAKNGHDPPNGPLWRTVIELEENTFRGPNRFFVLSRFCSVTGRHSSEILDKKNETDYHRLNDTSPHLKRIIVSDYERTSLLELVDFTKSTMPDLISITLVTVFVVGVFTITFVKKRKNSSVQTDEAIHQYVSTSDESFEAQMMIQEKSTSRKRNRSYRGRIEKLQLVMSIIIHPSVSDNGQKCSNLIKSHQEASETILQEKKLADDHVVELLHTCQVLQEENEQLRQRVSNFQRQSQDDDRQIAQMKEELKSLQQLVAERRMGAIAFIGFFFQTIQFLASNSAHHAACGCYGYSGVTQTSWTTLRLSSQFATDPFFAGLQANIHTSMEAIQGNRADGWPSRREIWCKHSGAPHAGLFSQSTQLTEHNFEHTLSNELTLTSSHTCNACHRDVSNFTPDDRGEDVADMGLDSDLSQNAPSDEKGTHEIPNKFTWSTQQPRLEFNLVWGWVCERGNGFAHIFYDRDKILNHYRIFQFMKLTTREATELTVE
ncbi:hypothetical protein PROFUN_14051 [Planoprotostelium fungivorum]|uniref:Uncharacterized protein n=1 Tax=Planoprotostelium fungivorum TaxID=1890364 RepID=A0A2P6N237_9EUKA|nr:hypothetical protein PROFUN_14051 [Planoprotostelium fungivorum]